MISVQEAQKIINETFFSSAELEKKGVYSFHYVFVKEETENGVHLLMCDFYFLKEGIYYRHSLNNDRLLPLDEDEMLLLAIKKELKRLKEQSQPDPKKIKQMTELSEHYKLKMLLL